jgi:hypothetical protein
MTSPATIDQLSALADRTVNARIARELPRAELRASAVALAQRFTEEVLIRDLSTIFFIPTTSESDADWVTKRERQERNYSRCYRIVDAEWKTGRFGRRIKHQASVLIREHDRFRSSLFWDPSAADRSWDTTAPPLVALDSLGGRSCSAELFAHQPALAASHDLALFAQDALAMMEGLAAEYEAMTEHIVDGVIAADRALGLLNQY